MYNFIICCHIFSLSIKISFVASLQVIWGKIPMVDAEKRLLGHALEDLDN